MKAAAIQNLGRRHRGGALQPAEEPVIAAVGAGYARGEVHGIGIATRSAIADLQSPQVWDHDRSANHIMQRSDVSAGRRVEYIDRSVAKISYK